MSLSRKLVMGKELFGGKANRKMGQPLATIIKGLKWRKVIKWIVQICV